MSEQEAFEKWYLGEDCKSSLNRNKEGYYVYAPAHTAWIVWQAATAEANKRIAGLESEVIEKCAKICESLKEQDYCVDVRAGAEAIRALKGKP